MGTAAARFSDGLRRLSSLQRQHRPLLEGCPPDFSPAFGLQLCMVLRVMCLLQQSSINFALVLRRLCWANVPAWSPHLAVCCLTPRISDPVVYLMSQSIGALRRMLLLLPDLGATWLRNAAALAQTSSRVIGPASALAKLLRDNQWTIQTSGVLKGPGHWRVDVRCSSTAAIRLACQGAWLEGLESRVGHRNGLARVDCPCPTTMASVLRRFPAGQQVHIAHSTVGGFMSGAARSKFDPLQSRACAYCGEVDTKWHRLFDCPALAATRVSFRSVAAMGPETTMPHWVHAPFPTRHEQEDFLRLLWAGRPILPPPEIHQLLRAQDGIMLYFFTDGFLYKSGVSARPTCGLERHSVQQCGCPVLTCVQSSTLLRPAGPPSQL